MRSSNWLENVDEDIIAPAIPSTTTSRRKFGTVLSSNSLPSHPPHKDLKKDLPPKRSSRAKNPLPSLPQILQQTISARLGSPLLQNLRTLLLRCDRNEFPTSINGFILPTPSEVDFLDLLLALQFQWREKSPILPHDLVPELKKALSSLNLEPAATEPKKPKRMVKPPKPKKERSAAIRSPPAASSLFLASSDSPPHLPQPLLSEQVRQAPKWRSREVLAEEDESEMRTRRDKRRSPLWKEMIEESSASEVIEESPSGEVSQETKEISTKLSALRLSGGEPYRKRSNSQPIPPSYGSPPTAAAHSPPRRSRPSSCSLLSSPICSDKFHDIIHTSVRFSGGSEDDSPPPQLKKHQRRLCLAENNPFSTPLRSSGRDSNSQSTPCSSFIVAQRLSHTFATPQDAHKMHHTRKYFHYPDREDEWNVSEQAGAESLASFWAVFRSFTEPLASLSASSLPTRLLGEIFSFLVPVDRVSVQLVSRQWALSLHFLRTQELCLLAPSRQSSFLPREGVPLLECRQWSRSFTDFFSEVSLVGNGTSKKVYSLRLHSSAVPVSASPSGPASATSPLLSDLSSSMTALVSTGRAVVVSVMDLEDLYSRDVSREMIETELQISLLSSSLSSLRICPCLLETFFFFRCDALLHEDANSKTRHKRQKGNKRTSEIHRNNGEQEGRYLYLGMEKCQGNLEEFLEETARPSPSPSPSPEYCGSSILAIFFQICYALYVCRDKMSMVHFDLKLLNCLYAAPPSPLVNQIQGQLRPEQRMLIGFEDCVYGVPISSPTHSTCGILKLIDFGTSLIDGKALGRPIDTQQFTTLENIPPEYLICGDANTACYSADSFQLGLCFLHLLMTGPPAPDLPTTAPYEEMMAEVHCPEALKRRICAVWMKRKKPSQSRRNLPELPSYGVLREVLTTLEGGSDGETILCDTLYRYLVLLYSPTGERSPPPLPSPQEEERCGCVFNRRDLESSEVWRAVREMCWEETRGREAEACRQQFLADSTIWSLTQGTHPVALRIRQHLSQLPPVAIDILGALLSFSPQDRPPLYDILTSDLFQEFLQTAGVGGEPEEGAEGEMVFLHYYRDPEQEQLRPSLPFLKRL